MKDHRPPDRGHAPWPRPAQARPRILAVADSDSYFKFACATLDALGAGWDRRVVLARTPILPTTEQRAAAVAGTFLQDGPPTTVLPVGSLGPLLDGADLVLAAATGPVVQQLFHGVSARHLRRAARGSGQRPAGRTTALVSALPGVAYPATEKAMRFRALGDAFITHSRAEARDFSGVLARLGSPQPLLTARLPFLRTAGAPSPDPTPVQAVVFAAQAKFPVERGQRERVLEALARTSRAHPGADVVVKLRARAGEPQTHREEFPYDQLWDALAARGRVGAGEVRFVTGPMAEVLRPGTLLATVSSTAVLEAVDRGLPALVLGDFGVGPELYNGVFTGSGLIGCLDDLEALAVRHADDGWLRENYFHPPGTATATDLLELARRGRAGSLSTSPGAVASARHLALRTRLRTVLPAPALHLIRTLRR